MKLFKSELINAQKAKSKNQENVSLFQGDCFERMKKFEEDNREKIDITCWNLLINLWDNDIVVSNIFTYMKESERVNENIYTATIRSLCVSGKYEHAYNTYIDMTTTDIHPHLRTLACFFGQEARLQYEFFGTLCIQIIKHNMIPTLDIFAKIIDSSNRLIGETKEGDFSPFLLVMNWISVYYDSVNNKVLHQIMIHYDITEKNHLYLGTEISENDICCNCQHIMERKDLTDEERQIFLEKMGQEFRNIKQLERYVHDHPNYDVIIDGANVSMYNNSPFNPKKVEAVLEHFTKRNKRVLIVFNVNRKKQVKNLRFNKKFVDVYYSQSGQNDDLFWLYCGIYYKQSLVVTDDKMCDHIYNIFNDLGVHTFRKWANLNVARFHFNNTATANKWLTIEYPITYSEKIQFSEDGNIHVPVRVEGGVDVDWYCFPKIKSQQNPQKRQKIKK